MSETIVISLCAFFHYFFEVAKRQVSTFYFHKKKAILKAGFLSSKSRSVIRKSPLYI
jgi:hypothetical protein